MSGIAAQWRMVADYLADAQTAARIMGNPALPAATRRAAAERHAVTVAALIDELTALRRDGVLDAIEDFLRTRYSGGVAAP